VPLNFDPRDNRYNRKGPIPFVRVWHMRKKFAAVAVGVMFGAHGAFAQPVAPTPPPGLLPPGLSRPDPMRPTAPQLPQANKPTPLVGDAMPLPFREEKFAVNALDVTVKRAAGAWQVWAGQRMLRDTGDAPTSEATARDIVRVYRDLRPTEWVTVGNATRPVVEYGLTNGKPAAVMVPPDGKNDPQSGVVQAGGANGPLATGAGAKVVRALDLKTVRAEAVRGVWVVRDESNLLLNFGPDKAGAEQAAAVMQRYGFNRVGLVGSPTSPAMSFLFAGPDEKPDAGGRLLFQSQVDALAVTGIPVPGVGYIGEMVKLNPRDIDARRDGTEWVVASGTQVLGRFGPTEFAARDAVRVIRDAGYTEFCRLGGTANVTFFLKDGKPPARAPFSAQGRSFDAAAVKAQQINGKWAVTSAGRGLFDASSQQEAEVVARVLQAYGFDQMAHLSSGSAKGGIGFMVKTR
jgi:hypothetical protein